MKWNIHTDDVLDALGEIEDNTFDAVFCDPPYGLSDSKADVSQILMSWIQGDDYDATGRGFMGRTWDAIVPQPTVWREVLRVCKPGANLMAFGGTRTVHMLTISLQLAGWEPRDLFQWIFGSGFPKSLDISKAIDDSEGAEREVVGTKYEGNGNGSTDATYGDYTAGHDGVAVTAPATDAAKRFDGYKSAIKPSYEPVVLARAPLDGTYANNATEHGVAGLNVDGCRIECDGTPPTVKRRESARANDWDATSGETAKDSESRGLIRRRGDPSVYQKYRPSEELGRYPSNVILDDTAASMLDSQTGDDVSRYFYCAKSSRAEREAGLDHLAARKVNDGRDTPIDNPYQRGESKRQNTHPCVKPLDLCRYFSKLLLPPPRDTDRRVLVPFSGSGSEMIGAMQAGWDHVTGIEMSPEYVEIAEARLEYWAQLGWQQDLL